MYTSNAVVPETRSARSPARIARLTFLGVLVAVAIPIALATADRPGPTRLQAPASNRGLVVPNPGAQASSAGNAIRTSVSPPATPATYQAYGMDFSPYVDGQDPNSGIVISEGQLLSRMQIIANQTVWVRSFGCTHGLEKTGMVAHSLGLHAAVGAWLSEDLSANDLEISNLITAANAGQVDLAIVGSEVLLRNDLTESQLIGYMNQVRQQIPANIPVATADVYGKLLEHPSVIASSDVVLPNYYPYWEGVSVNVAIATLHRQHQQLVAASQGKTVIVSETGWPSAGNSICNAVPSPTNASFYFLNFVSWARANNVAYFYFDAEDEAWKANHGEGPQGAHWGVWDKDGVLKPGMQAVFDGQTIPDNWTAAGIPGGTGTPSIEFTSVPPYGSSNNLFGQVLHVNTDDYKVAVYIYVGGWWTKPTFANPLTDIGLAGAWECDITTGGNDPNATQIVSFLVPATFSPPPMSGGQTLPPILDQTAVARADITRSSSALSIQGHVTDSNGQALSCITISMSGSLTAATHTIPNGAYSFINLQPGGTYTVTPTHPSYTFSPSSWTFTNLSSNQTGDFVATPSTSTIILSASPAAGGTVAGAGTYATGSSRTVTATANAGYTFANWTESGSIVSLLSSYTFTLGADRTLVANFTINPVTRSLVVASSNPSSGVSITVSPNDNNAQGNGVTQFTRVYNNNVVVMLTAPSTAGGNNFQKWQRDGADFAVTAATNVTMDANHTMTAVYVTTPPTRTLTVASSNPSSGVSTTVSPNDNNAQGNGVTQFTRVYNNNVVVTLVAPSTAGGNNFQKWQRDSVDFAVTASTNVTMDANHTMTAIYVTSGQTVLMDETFSGGIPATWSVVNGGSGGGTAATWTTANPGNRAIGGGFFSSPFAIIDSDFAGQAATQDEQLITPAINASSCSGRVVVEFGNQFRWFDQGQNEAADLDVSTNGGSTWTNVHRMQGSDNGYPIAVRKTIDITSAIGANRTNLKIRFHYYNASFEWWWAIDNVKVKCVSGPPHNASTTGIFRPSNGALYLKNSNTTGFADLVLTYGSAGDYPVAGDWNGDGVDTIGVYRNGTFYLRNTNTIGFADIVVQYGQAGDQPVVGDWDGDGVDTIGVFRNGTFLLRNSNTPGPADIVFGLGGPGDVGIAGDWDGDGIDTTGVYRPSNGALYLKFSNTTGFADLVLTYGSPGDKPVVGDWDGDGIDTIGIYRLDTFFLRNTNTNGVAEIVFTLGSAGDTPISGDWDGLP